MSDFILTHFQFNILYEAPFVNFLPLNTDMWSFTEFCTHTQKITWFHVVHVIDLGCLLLVNLRKNTKKVAIILKCNFNWLIELNSRHID